MKELEKKERKYPELVENKIKREKILQKKFERRKTLCKLKGNANNLHL